MSRRECFASCRLKSGGAQDAASAAIRASSATLQRAGSVAGQGSGDEGGGEGGGERAARHGGADCTGAGRTLGFCGNRSHEATPVVAAAGASVLAVGAVLAVSRAENPAGPASRFKPPVLPGENFTLMPESERTFARVVIGLRAHRASRRARRGPEESRAIELRRRVYGLDFELLHGGTIRAAPSYSTFYVAVPNPETAPGASGEEESDFRAYLAERLGWSEEEIRRRVRFFPVAKPLLYPQDMAEILGLDSSGRLVLGVGGDTDPQYIEPVERLVREFPAEFAFRRLAGLHVGDVNTEGGDLALSWLPDGKLGVLVGRHRATRFLVRRTAGALSGGPLSPEEIADARRAYSSAFFGVEAVIVGEGALSDPSRGSEELFHADMVVAVLRNDHEALAFVPTYEVRPRDANSGELLPEAFVRDVQYEYELVAGEMKARGYRVVRLPFEDHPVRAPVNVSKFVDRTTGKPFVLLGRYPEHRPAAPGAPSAMRRLSDVVVRLQGVVDAWEEKPDDRRWSVLKAALAGAWRELDAASAVPNPVFEKQRAIYESNGIGVVPVAQFPTGAGGVHCLLLR